MLRVCHRCANPLTAHYGITYGTAIGAMLPSVIRFNGHSVDSLYADLVRERDTLNGEPASEVLTKRIAQLVQTAGLPTRLRDCEVSQSILPLLAEEAYQQWTARFNPRDVDDASILQIYQAAW